MKIHFIGIGGIGVSALARYYLVQGHQVSGSDLESSPITQDLEKLGAKIKLGPHRPENLPLKTDQVIFTVATEDGNPELLKAKELNIPDKTYPQALGELTRQKETIAIAGAHGKGTTTALTSLILIEAGLDPTVIVGTNLKEFGNANCRLGQSDYLIIEADEYGRAFLNYWPRMIAITNIDKEHLDCYQNLDEIIRTFKQFSDHLPDGGLLVINQDDLYSRKLKHLLKDSSFEIKEYSLKQKETDQLKKILRIPGEHNLANALAALVLARQLKIPDEVSFSALAKYRGAWRRFEIVQEKPLTVISDYAHHPSEIKATLAGTREKFPGQRIWAIFQPHHYQRTYYLFKEFLSAFNLADEIILTEIYSVAGRETEEIKQKTSGQKLADAFKAQGKNICFIADFLKIPEYLKTKVEPGDVVLIMGAGSIYKIVPDVEKLI